ncbi:hypothetical protein MNBD_GAMMA11-601 [hydrothermal vent metagenome]|uniref:DUF2914 domain-containing protein n=1 Tax=hydrothermal vent metagenome TaxID=652676 RepID=A0A3B0XET1_9ZZZZ
MKHVLSSVFAGLVLVSFNVYSETGVSRSVFTTAIENREPVSELKRISTENTRVYFFTELQGLGGHTLTHRWLYNGQVLAEISFKIAADRWRTWSSKNMLASWTGNWQVSVLDEGGNIVEQAEFEYFHLDDVNAPEDMP